jgi:hypothetical protein
VTRLLLLLALVACARSSDKQQNEQGSATATISNAPSRTSSNAPLPAFELKLVNDGEAADIATLKARTSGAVSKWLTEEPTSDGWIVTYEIPRVEQVQDEKTLKMEPKQVGLDFGVYVRRTIDGKQYKCVTTHITRREDIARVVDACKKATPPS